MSGQRITVVVAASVRIFREGLAEVLDGKGSIVVAGTAADAREIDKRLAEKRPNVLLADTALLGPTARVASFRRRSPSLRVVAIGAFEDADEVVAYAEAGVAGYVTREQSLAELVATLESVVRGEMLCAPRIAAALLRRVATVAGEGRAVRRATPARLTARELDVVDLLGDGLSNKQIAWQLRIEVATVKNHVHNILDKLEVSSRADVASWALGQQLAGR